jgi:hypothetical protein
MLPASESPLNAPPPNMPRYDCTVDRRLQLVVVHLARDVLMYILLCERCIEEVSSPDFARNTHTVRAKVDSAQVCIVWC